MSRYGNNAAEPLKTQPTQKVTADDYPDVDSTQPVNDYESDDNGADIIERIRAKRKREESMKSLPEAKRTKVETAAGEPTVLLVFNIQGSWSLRTNKFVIK